MDKWTPENMPEITVIFDYEPEEPMTWDEPGWSAEVYFDSIEINGKSISDYLFEAIIKEFEVEWTKQIIKEAKK